MHHCAIFPIQVTSSPSTELWYVQQAELSMLVPHNQMPACCSIGKCAADTMSRPERPDPVLQEHILAERANDGITHIFSCQSLEHRSILQLPFRVQAPGASTPAQNAFEEFLWPLVL